MIEMIGDRISAGFGDLGGNAYATSGITLNDKQSFVPELHAGQQYQVYN